tara:strand:+ start:4872 stop:6338 length:1467 start_codon:yes stop_codon:yes gene_type:complete
LFDKTKMSRNLFYLVEDLIEPEASFKNINISGIKTDSNKILPGDLFVAIPGMKYDGHDFVKEAISNGASAIITNGRDMDIGAIPQIKVANPRRAASLVSSKLFNSPSKGITVIGITGTNGKTTTAYLIRNALNKAGYKTAQIGTTGVIAEGFDQKKTLTTPDAVSLQKLLSELKNSGFTHIVMEVSSHALDQYRVADISFNFAVFTNLTPEHLDYHPSMEAYYQAKSRLFKMLTIDAVAIINSSDLNGERIARETVAPVLFFSRENGDTIHFSKADSTLEGIKGTIKAGDFSYDINSNFIGDFNKENILASVSVLHAIGLGSKAIADGISSCTSVPGRLEIFKLLNGAKVVIDYAHTPDAYDKVLGTLRKLINEDNKIYAIFGAGGDRDRNKRPEMAKIAEMFCHKCFITPDNPRNEDINKINKDIVSGFTKNCYEVFYDRAEALNTALKLAKKNDIVVILGKGREEFQEVKGEKLFHSDYKIINEWQ